jgi:putative hemolysin
VRAVRPARGDGGVVAIALAPADRARSARRQATSLAARGPRAAVAKLQGRPAGNHYGSFQLKARHTVPRRRHMGRAALLWLIGISYPDHPDRVAVGRAALGPPRRAESSTRPRYRSRGFCHSPFPPVGRRCEEKRRSARHPWRKREVPQRSSDGGGRWILTPNKGCATCASCRSRSGRTSRSFSWRRQSCRAKTLEFLGWRGPKRAVELIKDRGKNRIANAART